VVETKTDIRKLSLEELKEYLVETGEKAFRAKQIYSWLWQKGATSIADMTNLSKPLREQLSEHFTIHAITQDVVQHSADGTVKVRYRLHDGHLMESVLIPVPTDDRYTVCVSSQVGCSLTCTFCATGKMKRLRNLDPGEIFDQVVLINKICEQKYGHPLTNIVYMGMGEPLLAYKSVMQSIEHITSPSGLHMSPRRITVSTAGIAKMTGNRISYEYITFQRFNDSIEDAKNLVKLCRKFPVRVNIIEYNPIDGAPFVKSDAARIDVFAQYLRDHKVTVTVRRSRGKDIDAACGQLANKG